MQLTGRGAVSVCSRVLSVLLAVSQCCCAADWLAG